MTHIMITEALIQDSIPIIQSALREDIPTVDITSELCVDPNQQGSAQILAKESGIFCGELIFKILLKLFPRDIQIKTLIPDAAPFEVGDQLALITGNMRRILGIERVLLNFCQHLSGIATVTQSFVRALDDSQIQILDTRKTTPGIRNLERYAVRVGGGHNHRLNLSDMILIKENHIQSFLKTHSSEAFSRHLAMQKSQNPDIKIEMEIDSLEQLLDFDLSPVDIVLLDNFNLDSLQKALTHCKRYPHLLIEASGNVSLDTIARYRGLPIHRISIGKLTHSVPNIDLSLLVLDEK